MLSRGESVDEIRDREVRERIMILETELQAIVCRRIRKQRGHELVESYTTWLSWEPSKSVVSSKDEGEERVCGKWSWSVSSKRAGTPLAVQP